MSFSQDRQIDRQTVGRPRTQPSQNPLSPSTSLLALLIEKFHPFHPFKGADRQFEMRGERLTLIVVKVTLSRHDKETDFSIIFCINRFDKGPFKVHAFKQQRGVGKIALIIPFLKSLSKLFGTVHYYYPRIIFPVLFL
jgi:hypothetical protein